MSWGRKEEETKITDRKCKCCGRLTECVLTSKHGVVCAMCFKRLRS